jgi:hypothetical protein
MVSQEYDMVKRISKNQDEFDSELSTIPNEKYQKFFAKFDEIDNLDISEWRAPHLLGYFCRKYKQTYQADYSWKFNNESPAKCFEVWQFNTLCAKLSANPKILKDYIDWVYDVEVPKVKTKFRSISFLTQDERVIFYKMNILLAGAKNLSVDRSTPLPTIYRDTLKSVANLTINTYGDLAFVSQMDPMPDNIATAMDQITEQGFDREILKRIV